MKYKAGDNDLRDLLKIGYGLENEYQIVTIADESHLRDLKNRFDSELREKTIKTTIDKIYRPKYNGIKPMEWELVWERKEPKYYLRSWIDEWGDILEDVFESEENYLNLDKDEVEIYLSHNKNSKYDQTQFTQKEINNLPNQEFIKTLVKEEAK